MKRNLYLLAIIAAGVLLLPDDANARRHVADIVDANSTNPVLWAIAIAYDNLMHFVEHVVLTTQVLMNDPASALMVLNGIGEACFVVEPPASHALFADGIKALTTTAAVWLLIASTLVMALSRAKEIVRSREALAPIDTRI